MVEARPAQRDDIPGIAAALTRSFDDDPVMGYMFPKPGQRARNLKALFASESKRALGKGSLFTIDDARALGAAIWSPPGLWKVGGVELLGQLPLLLTMGSALRRSLGVLTRMEKVHPHEPHWYLNVLGTDPDHQGKGVGSALITPILQQCDEEGVPAYLESSKESNIPFYRRHGFVVTGEVVIPGGPTLWPMWRDPQVPH